MNYCAARIAHNAEQKADLLSFRVYVTDTLQVIAENTAISANKFLEEPVGMVMSCRWIDRNKPATPEENRTAEEIVDHIRSRLKEVD